MSSTKGHDKNSDNRCRNVSCRIIISIAPMQEVLLDVEASFPFLFDLSSSDGKFEAMVNVLNNRNQSLIERGERLQHIVFSKNSLQFFN